MTTMTNPIEKGFVVVHPLDDRPEEKVNIETLGRMPMTRSVRLSLLTLRGYLLLMMAIVLYRACDLAGLLH